VEWWADGGFSDRTTLTAAELVAFDALQEVTASTGRWRDPDATLAAGVEGGVG
jgi:hypothetical protein